MRPGTEGQPQRGVIYTIAPSALKAGLFAVAPINIFLILTFALIKEMPSSVGVFAVESLMGLAGGLAGGALEAIDPESDPPPLTSITEAERGIATSPAGPTPTMRSARTTTTASPSDANSSARCSRGAAPTADRASRKATS